MLCTTGRIRNFVAPMVSGLTWTYCDWYIMLLVSDLFLLTRPIDDRKKVLYKGI